jgi:hypothetical protein
MKTPKSNRRVFPRDLTHAEMAAKLLSLADTARENRFHVIASELSSMAEVLESEQPSQCPARFVPNA